MSLTVELCGEELDLLPEKAILWKREEVMLLADLHLGKVNHFRRSGVPLPRDPNIENLNRLISLLHTYEPARVIFLGDLFHSHYNSEWEEFGQVIRAFPQVQFDLVMGNHDILSNYQYVKHELTMHKESLSVGPFTFTHIPSEKVDGYNLAGHIHPGVRLHGRGRQALRFPCFYFSNQQGILPAFGALTGNHPIRPKKSDRIYIVAEQKVIALK